MEVKSSSSSIPEPLFSLYIGDLDPTVTEEQLIQTFSKVDGYFSAALCTADGFNKSSLCYGYVNFHNIHGATRALETLNHKILNGKSIRVMWSTPNSEARLSGIGNVFVKNLARSIDNVKLHQIFSEFGNIMSSKVAVSDDGKSKGYGFVQYSLQDYADKAIEKLHGAIVEEKELYVGEFIKRVDRIQEDASFNNLYIKNLDRDVTEKLLEEKFSKFGIISSLVIIRDANGTAKGFGFVNFENSDDAKRAKETMHGTTLGSKILFVARAQKKAERRAILRAQFDKIRKERAQLYKGQNLYVKNINDDVDEAELIQYFSQCGTISSAKIMRTDKGISKGFGFVCFSNPEAARRAINSLNGILFHQKPLYVAIAQTKKERKSYLQMMFAKPGVVAAAGLPGPIASSTHNFPPCPGLYQQQQQPLQVYQAPDFRHGRIPNGFAAAPFIGQQPRPHPMFPMAPPNNSVRQYYGGGRMNRPANFLMPFMTKNLWGPSYEYPSHQQQQQVFMTNEHQRAAASHENLSSMLAAASSDERKDILGQRLYPLVKKLKHDLSPKLTEMLLEMDHSELLVLLDSPESLAAKVEEAMKVLQLPETNKANNSQANGQD